MINLQMDEKTFEKLLVYIITHEDTEDAPPPEVVKLIYDKVGAIQKRKAFQAVKFSDNEKEKNKALKEYARLKKIYDS